MGVGGIERCLLNLLKNIDYSEYSVDLLIMQREYEFMDMIDKRVHILNQYQYLMTTTETVNEFRKLGVSPVRYIKYLIYRFVNKFGKRPWKLFEKIPYHYDTAIAYGINGSVPYYVIDKIDADNKILWHHNGEYVYLNTDREKEDRKFFAEFNSVICVSGKCRENFISAFPELADRTHVVINYLDTEAIDRQKDEFRPDFSANAVNLVTVGRMSEEKGPDLMIDTAKLLAEEKKNFHWYWCGDGNYMENAVKRISDEGLSDYITLLGNCINPYPYIKNCDIYVQPSKYEGYCTTTNEAKYLCKPIISTDVGGTQEQFVNGKNAIICAKSSEYMASEIIRLIDSSEKRKNLSEELLSERNGINNEAGKYKQYM